MFNMAFSSSYDTLSNANAFPFQGVSDINDFFFELTGFREQEVCINFDKSNGYIDNLSISKRNYFDVDGFKELTKDGLNFFTLTVEAWIRTLKI